MKVLARVNPAYASALAKEQNLRAEIAKVTAQELKGTNISVAQAQARQQAQWDANGQAIYAANQQFKGLDTATKEQAIKDATVNGVFNAGLYSVNLNTAQAKQEEEAEEQRRAEQAAMQEAQRQAEEEAERQNALADFRAGEQNAVAIAAEFERELAIQSYRAGEQVAQEKTNGNLLFALWNASMSALGTIASPLKNIYSNKSDDPTVGETLVPRPSRWTIYYLPEQAVMKTYLAASINVQSDGKNVDEKDRNSHLGPAQLSRNELDTPYKTGFNDDGSICEGVNCRGYGLGLPGENPHDNATAVRGMDRRIQQVFDRAEKLSEKNNIILTNTDKYIIEAMAQNGPGFDYNDINRVMMPENGFITDGQINWEAYFEVKQGEWDDRVSLANKNPFIKENAEVILYNSLLFTNGVDFDTRYSLEKFYGETSDLEGKGYSLPQDLDIERIKELIENDSSTGGGK